jgi:pimeloyl-ACP methyl ester carboxylesterase
MMMNKPEPKHTLESGDAYWTYHDADLPTIIMIHGFRGTHHGMDLIAKNLPNFHIIVPDLPGFGETGPIEKHDLDGYIQWLHKFLRQLTLPSAPVLLGHSFGSIVTAGYAAKYPRTISKLVLVNPIGAPALEGPRGLLTKLALFYYWSGRMLPAKLARRWLSMKPAVALVTVSMTKSKDKTLRTYIHDQHFKYFSLFYDLKSLSESFHTSVTNNVRQSAPYITVPTLVIAGERDDITPVNKQQELVMMIPDGTLEIIKRVGHLTHYETPEQVAEAIKSFI